MAFTGNFACNSFKTGLMKGTFDFDVDTYYIALYTNAASFDYSTTEYTSTGEVVASGYSASPLTVTVLPTTGTTGTVAYISFSNVSWTAAFTARGALIYKPGANGAMCVLDFGSDKTSTTTFTVQFPAATNTSAIIRIA
jgi:hypothetical protein